MSIIESTQEFIDNATWLTDEDKPMVDLLLMSAESLVNDYRAATANTYGVTYRTLMKRKAAGPQEDEDEDFFNNL